MASPTSWLLGSGGGRQRSTSATRGGAHAVCHRDGQSSGCCRACRDDQRPHQCRGLRGRRLAHARSVDDCGRQRRDLDRHHHAERTRAGWRRGRHASPARIRELAASVPEHHCARRRHRPPPSSIGTNRNYRRYSGLAFTVTISAAHGTTTTQCAAFSLTAQPRPGPLSSFDVQNQGQMCFGVGVRQSPDRDHARIRVSGKSLRLRAARQPGRPGRHLHVQAGMRPRLRAAGRRSTGRPVQ